MMRTLAAVLALAAVLGGCMDVDAPDREVASGGPSGPGPDDKLQDDPSMEALDRIEAAVLRKLAQAD